MGKSPTGVDIMPSSSPGTLPRGKACLRCRKRKMRCDGVKPSCQQCCRAKKPDGCEYDDGKGKTRTQLLRETISRLEQRIRDLEDPELSAPSVTLFNPHNHQRSSFSSGSSDGSADLMPYTTSHSSFTSDPGTPPLPVWSVNPTIDLPSLLAGGGIPSPSPSPLSFFDTSYDLEMQYMLLDIFATHRRQCGLEIHMGRLQESLSLPPAQQRHPVLLNAFFLWACYMSRPAPLSQQEPQYLARALDALHDSLRSASRALDTIQASCLLSLYFLSNGRILEGSYHASSAASLAIQCGLHHRMSLDDIGPVDPLRLGPPKDLIEEGERISAFWQAFNLDRCWSVVLRKRPTIPDGRDPLTAIRLPWPQSMEEYETGQLDETHQTQTIRSFLEGQSPIIGSGYSTLALRVKASALFERADRISTCWDPRVATSDAYREEFQILERTISRFIPTVVPPHQLDATTPEDKHALITIHCLAQAAMIHLYYRFSQDDALSYEKSLRAARACVAVIKNISDSDYDFLDPILGPCWTCAAEVLLRELGNKEAAWPLVESTETRSEISTILYAMNTLGTRFPLLSYSTAKIQKRLTEL